MKTNPAPSSAATPNRDGPPREPAVIDGEAERIDPPKAAASPEPAHPQQTAAQQTAAQETAAPEPAQAPGSETPEKTRPPLLAPLLVLGAAAIVSAGALYALLPSGGAGTGGADPAALAALETRVGALERATKAAESRAGEALAQARQSILAEAVRQAGEAAKAAAPAPAPAPAPAAAEPAPARASEALAALASRLEAVEKALAAPKSETRAEPDVRAPAPASTPAPVSAPPVDLGPLEARLGALEERLKPFEERLAAMPGALDQMRETLRKTNAAETARAQTGADLSRAAAQAAVAQSLVAALDQGRPFAAELDALAALGGAPARLDALRPLAATGAPRLEAIARAFAQTEPRLTQALAKSDPASEGETSLLDRLARSAGALVRVRPVGEPDATAAADAPARIERALARADLRAALAEWDRLPEEAKAASGEWAKVARARQNAQEAAQSLFAEALARLGKP